MSHAGRAVSGRHIDVDAADADNATRRVPRAQSASSGAAFGKQFRVDESMPLVYSTQRRRRDRGRHRRGDGNGVRRHASSRGRAVLVDKRI